MISAVTLNWERPYNLTRIILPLLEDCPCIDEIIISHGKQDTVFDYESERCRIVHRHDYGDIERQYGMARRFLAYDDATNEVILSLDDDILIPKSSLSALYDEFVRDPEVIHSLYGRNSDESLSYRDLMFFGEVTYALVGAALLPKRLGRLFFEYAPLVSGLAKHWPFWGVEDLFVSLVAIKTNRRLNRAYPLPRVDLRGSPEAGPRTISDAPGHLADRRRFSQRATAALQVGDLIKTAPGSDRHDSEASPLSPPTIRGLRALVAVASKYPSVFMDILGASSRGALGDARHMVRTMAGPPHSGAKLLSRQYRFLWMINPKVAAQSILAALRGADPDAERTGERSVSKLYALHPEAREYYSFAFVRHPFARALSLYCHLYVSPEVYTDERGNGIRYLFVDRFRNGVIDSVEEQRGNGIHYLFSGFYGLADVGSFEDYCEWLNTPYGSDAVADRHFLSQHRQIGLADGRLPDFVGRIENLDEDWQRLAAHLGLPATALPLMNTMAGWPATQDALKTARSAAMEAHMTERSKTLLRTRYAEDFRLFGYSPD